MVEDERFIYSLTCCFVDSVPAGYFHWKVGKHGALRLGRKNTCGTGVYNSDQLIRLPDSEKSNPVKHQSARLFPIKILSNTNIEYRLPASTINHTSQPSTTSYRTEIGTRIEKSHPIMWKCVIVSWRIFEQVKHRRLQVQTSWNKRFIESFYFIESHRISVGRNDICQNNPMCSLSCASRIHVERHSNTFYMSRNLLLNEEWKKRLLRTLQIISNSWFHSSSADNVVQLQVKSSNSPPSEARTPFRN